MRKIILAFLIAALLSNMTIAQKQKPWTEWSKKDAEKMLNESAWGQTQTDTDTSEMTYSGTSDPNTAGKGAVATRDTTSTNNDNRLGSGAKNQALSLTYRVRFFTAKPIREAFARMIVLQQKAADEQKVKELATKFQGWIDGDMGDFVVVAVTIEATDRRLSGPAEQAFNSSTADLLKNKCYLELKDGKRVFLTGYEPPTADQTGAKFVFPRTINGQPILTAESESVRFVAEFNDKVKIIRKYKVADMMYNGKLEY